MKSKTEKMKITLKEFQIKQNIMVSKREKKVLNKLKNVQSLQMLKFLGIFRLWKELLSKIK